MPLSKSPSDWVRKRKYRRIRVYVSSKIFGKYYGLKKKLRDKYRISLGTDYIFLNQLASFSYSDRWATSGIFRFYGTWDALVTENGYNGSLNFKIENRHRIGNGQIPRQLGYETGSAMSTASYKDFYWGLGIAIGITIARDFYIAGGMHDANGEPQNFLSGNFESFFGQSEYFYWAEVGWKESRSLVGGETVHLTYWYQDTREDQGTEASNGWCFSASRRFGSYVPFVRAGITNGNAALMHHLVMAGVGIDAFRGDNLGIGLNWGGPNDRTRRDQYSLELFYAIQLTQHVNIMPDIQLTMNPSFNDTQDLVAVFSTIRIRYAM